MVQRAACESSSEPVKTVGALKERRRGKEDEKSDEVMRLWEKERKWWRVNLKEVLDAAFRHSEAHHCGVLKTDPDPFRGGMLFISWGGILLCMTTSRVLSLSNIALFYPTRRSLFEIYSTKNTHPWQYCQPWDIHSSKMPMFVNACWVTAHCWSSSDHGELVHVSLQCSKTCKSKTNSAGMNVRQEAQ